MTFQGNRFITTLFVLLLVAVGQPVAAHAVCQEGSAHAYFILKTPQSSGGCTVVVPPAVTAVEVWADATVPLTKARFSLPDPPVGFILSEVYEFPYTGDRTTGVELDLGGCVTDSAVKLATFMVFLTDLTGQCVPWNIDDSPEIVDCDGIARPATTPYDYEFSAAADGCCAVTPACGLPPSNVFPLDGATNVPLDVELSWEVEFGLDDFMQLAIGTDPTCGDLAVYFFSGNSFAPDFLLPETTYYWWVSWSYFECNGRSPTMTFTTGGTLPAETTTWGGIKSLYE